MLRPMGSKSQTASLTTGADLSDKRIEYILCYNEIDRVRVYATTEFIGVLYRVQR